MLWITEYVLVKRRARIGIEIFPLIQIRLKKKSTTKTIKQYMPFVFSWSNTYGKSAFGLQQFNRLDCDANSILVVWF